MPTKERSKLFAPNDNMEYETEYKASFRINGYDVDFPINRIPEVVDISVVDIDLDKVEE